MIKRKFRVCSTKLNIRDYIAWNGRMIANIELGNMSKEVVVAELELGLLSLHMPGQTEENDEHVI
jgi:hypothetical protein